MGIDNFSKEFFLNKVQTIEAFLSNFKNKNVCFIFDCSLILLTPNTNLKLWINQLQIMLNKHKIDYNMILVTDNSKIRCYSKIWESIFRSSSKLKPDYFEFSTLEKQNSINSDANTMKIRHIEAASDGDRTIVSLVELWRSKNVDNMACICSRDQDFLYFYLGIQNVFNFFFDYNLNIVTKNANGNILNNILDIKRKTLHEKSNDYNLYGFKFDYNKFKFKTMQDFFGLTSVSNYDAIKHDYIFEILIFFINLLEFAKTDVKIKDGLCQNFLKYCTFVVDSDFKLCGLINKVKQKKPNYVFLDINSLFQTGIQNGLQTQPLFVVSWAFLNKKICENSLCDKWLTFFDDICSNFTTSRSKSHLYSKFYIDVSKLNSFHFLIETNVNLFFMSLDFFSILLSKMNRWINYMDEINKSIFDEDIIGNLIAKLWGILIVKSCELMNLDLDIIVEKYKIHLFLQNSKNIFLKNFYIYIKNLKL